jgi:hypothetical protein
MAFSESVLASQKSPWKIQKIRASRRNERSIPEPAARLAHHDVVTGAASADD